MDFLESRYEEYDDTSLLGALRQIGESIDRRKGPINPLTGTPIPEKVKPAKAATDDGLPSLEEDNLEVLRKAKAAMGEASQASQEVNEKPQESYDELKKKHQLDLNDEKSLEDAGLEDPVLMEHMEQARAALAEHERRLDEIPSEEEMRRVDTAARRMLSKLTTGLTTRQRTLQSSCEDIHLQSANAMKLANAGRPHGFPEVFAELTPSQQACFEMLSKKLESVSKDMEALGESLEQFSADFVLARRAHETAVTGLTRRCVYFEELAKKATECLEDESEGDH